jgi:hypothetical protein
MPFRPQSCFYLVSLLLSAFVAYAQNTEEEDSSLTWDPNGTTFIVHVQPYYLEYNKANSLNFGMGAKGDILLPRYLSLQGSFKQALFDLNHYNSNKGLVSSQNATKLFFQYEAGLGLFFNYVGYARTRVYAWPGTEFYVDPVVKDTMYTFTPQYLPARVMIGLRGGMYNWSQTIDKTSAKGDLAGEAPGSGSQFIFPDTSDVYTVIRSNGFYAGVSVSKLLRIFYHTDNGEEEEISFIRNIYVDMLYSPTIKIDQILFNGVPYNVIGKGGFKTQNIGARLIFEKVGCIDFPRLNISYRFEVGVRPGIAGRGGYIMQTIGLGFSQ